MNTVSNLPDVSDFLNDIPVKVLFKRVETRFGKEYVYMCIINFKFWLKYCIQDKTLMKQVRRQVNRTRYSYTDLVIVES